MALEISALEILIPENENLGKINLSDIKGEGFYQNGTLNYQINGALWNGTIQSELEVQSIKSGDRIIG